MDTMTFSYYRIIIELMANQLEGLGVLGKPEDYGITVKHVSPSFLVKDARSWKTRFVTAFNNNNLSAYHQTASITCEYTL